MVWLTDLLLLVLYVATSIAGLTLLKLGGAAVNSKSVSGGLLYFAGFALWVVVLYRMPLSRAFPLAAGSLIVGTQLSGRLFLDEELSPAQLSGVSLIMLGVLLVFSQR